MTETRSADLGRFSRRIWSECSRRGLRLRAFELTRNTRLGRSSLCAEGPLAFKPWREVGWILLNGECVAVERSGEQTRARRSVLPW
jgi:hypothetical protein